MIDLTFSFCLIQLLLQFHNIVPQRSILFSLVFQRTQSLPQLDCRTRAVRSFTTEKLHQEPRTNPNIVQIEYRNRFSHLETNYATN